MRNKCEANHVLYRDGIYYYVRRVPHDLTSHYDVKRLCFSLKTKSPSAAIRASKSINQRLEDYWLGLRLQNMDIPAIQVVKSSDSVINDGLLLSQACELYLRLKSVGKDKVFIRTVKRVFSSIRAIINLAISEQGLECRNPFANTFFPDDDNVQSRQPISIQYIRKVQSLCEEIDDDMRWLIALISDTGMRLGEAAGLLTGDIKLGDRIPHVDLKPHSWRSLKTKGSQRCVPLVGAALWASKRLLEANDDSIYAFPRYCDATSCKANSASGGLNKWLHQYVPYNCVIHSFRHSLRDRLRALECPSDIVDAIGGWKTSGVGHGYGSSYPLDVLNRWMKKL